MTDPDFPTAGRRPHSPDEDPISGTPDAVRYLRPAPGAALTPEPAPPAAAAFAGDHEAPTEDGKAPAGDGKAPAGDDDEPTGDDEVTTRLDPPPAPSPAAASPPAASPGSRPARDLDGPTLPLGRPSPARAASPAGNLDGPTQPLERPASPERVTPDSGAHDVPAKAEEPPAKPAPWRRVSSAGALIGVLLALFGFTLVVQLRSNDGDQGLATARQEDLVRILSDLEARDSRLQSEISALETSQRQLTSGVAGRQAALAEAEKRADELGLLAGTLPGRGPGLVITMDKVKSPAVLNAVQELRGAGGEVMQIAGANGQTVRLVASSYFVDAEGGGIVCDGVALTGPYLLTVIGSPQTMQTALQIPGGVVASVNSGGGSVTMEQRAEVEVTAVHQATALQYAKPAS